MAGLKGLSEGAWFDKGVILPADLLGPRFVGPVAVLDDVDDVGYATLARGVTGILLDDTVAGTGTVKTGGVQRITVDDAYSAGDILTLGASGKATAITATEPALVRILADTAADNDIVECELLASFPLAGSELVRVSGEVTPTSASHTVVTGLSLVTWSQAGLKGAPTLTHMFSQADKGDQAGTPAAGSILIVSQKPTGAADVTPIAATTPWGVVSWEAEGYR